jgi:hypothetical protein
LSGRDAHGVVVAVVVPADVELGVLLVLEVGELPLAPLLPLVAPAPAPAGEVVGGGGGGAGVTFGVGRGTDRET